MNAAIVQPFPLERQDPCAKKCPKCKCVKPFSDFFFDKLNDRLSSWCNLCTVQGLRDRREAEAKRVIATCQYEPCSCLFNPRTSGHRKYCGEECKQLNDKERLRARYVANRSEILAKSHNNRRERRTGPASFTKQCGVCQEQYVTSSAVRVTCDKIECKKEHRRRTNRAYKRLRRERGDLNRSRISWSRSRLFGVTRTCAFVRCGKGFCGSSVAFFCSGKCGAGKRGADRAFQTHLNAQEALLQQIGYTSELNLRRSVLVFRRLSGRGLLIRVELSEWHEFDGSWLDFCLALKRDGRLR